MRTRLFVWLTLVAAPLFAPLLPHALHCAKSVCMDIRAAGMRVPEKRVDSGEGRNESRLAQAEVPRQDELAAQKLEGVREQEGATNSVRSDAAVEQERLAEAVASVPESDFRQALEASLHDQKTQGAQFRELVVRRWAELDPKAAAAWASALQDPGAAVPLIKQAAVVWANKDMSAALEWANALPAGTAREAVVIAVGYEAARTPSFAAFDLVASLAPSSERDALLVHIARQWAASDFSEAADWAGRVPDASLRERLISAVATSGATKEPRAAASLIATNMSAGHAQDQAAIAIVQRWGQTDREEAAAWVSQFPDASVKASGARELSAE